jgi:hypothetical protein
VARVNAGVAADRGEVTGGGGGRCWESGAGGGHRGRRRRLVQGCGWERGEVAIQVSSQEYIQFPHRR